MIYLFYGIHVLICLFLILVVLLQQGKGADLSVFGGGGTMTAFGARGATTLLHKLTVYAFIGFIVTTLGIGILQSHGTSSSVMSVVDDLEGEAAGGDEAGIAEPGAVDDAEAAADESLEGIFPEAEAFEEEGGGSASGDDDPGDDTGTGGS